jgi:hypothetical protein
MRDIPPASEFPLYMLVTVRDGWGDVYAKGMVSGYAGPYSLVIITMAGREILVSTSLVELA